MCVHLPRSDLDCSEASPSDRERGECVITGPAEDSFCYQLIAMRKVEIDPRKSIYRADVEVEIVARYVAQRLWSALIATVAGKNGHNPRFQAK